MDGEVNFDKVSKIHKQNFWDVLSKIFQEDLDVCVWNFTLIHLAMLNDDVKMLKVLYKSGMRILDALNINLRNG